MMKMRTVPVWCGSDDRRHNTLWETDGIRCSRCRRTKDGVVGASACATWSVSLGAQDGHRSSLKDPSSGSHSCRIPTNKSRCNCLNSDIAWRLRTNLTIVEEINGICVEWKWLVSHTVVDVLSQVISPPTRPSVTRQGWASQGRSSTANICHPASYKSLCTLHKYQDKKKKTALPASQQINNFLLSPQRTFQHVVHWRQAQCCLKRPPPSGYEAQKCISLSFSLLLFPF